MSRKTVSDPDSHDLNTEVALFRYGLIAQLVHDPPPSGRQEQRLRTLQPRPIVFPVLPARVSA